MKRIMWALGLILGVAVLTGAEARADDEAWLHIKVEEAGRHGETVRINLPLSLIEELLPLVTTEVENGDVTFVRGRIRIHPNEMEMDLPAIMKALRKAQDGEYIRVESLDENVRVAKVDDKLVVHVDEADEQVRINLRLDMIEAMTTENKDEIDLVALVRALRDQGDGDLVTVISEDEHVRIWVDHQASTD